jgi:hypothetical protein
VDALKLNITIPKGRKKLGGIRGQKGNAMNKDNEENKHVNMLPQGSKDQATLDKGQRANNKKLIDAYGFDKYFSLNVHSHAI